MRTFHFSGLITFALMAAFWAYLLIDSLMRQFSTNVTYVDLVAIFVLGVIAGLALGMAMMLRHPHSSMG